MKLFKLCSVLCVTLCIVGLGIDLHVSASTGLEEKNRKVEEYVQQVQEHNEEVSLLNLEDIPATITILFLTHVCSSSVFLRPLL